MWVANRLRSSRASTNAQDPTRQIFHDQVIVPAYDVRLYLQIFSFLRDTIGYESHTERGDGCVCIRKVYEGCNQEV